VHERYDDIGRGYGRLRSPDRRIYRQIRRSLAGSRSVLNLGAGTGSYEPKDLSTVAIEPSIEMIKQRSNRANAIQARAEALPVRDNSFDASLAILTIHHWSNVKKGLSEAARSAKRKITILTWDPEFEGFWLTREYFPELLKIDQMVFPSISDISKTLGSIEVQVVPIPADCADGFTGAYWRRPEAYLNERIRAGMSSFARIKNVEDRIAQLKSDLDSYRWYRTHQNLLSATAIDLGYRLVTATMH
jgi:SAM-dependent methyltransferase